MPHKGQPARYIAENNVQHYYQQPVAATPGYYRETSPAKTTCTPTYSGGIFINGVYKKIIQAKLVRHPHLQKSGLQGLQELQVVLAGILM